MKNKERLTTLSVVSLKNLKPSKKVSSAIDYIKDVIQRQPNRTQERSKGSSGVEEKSTKASQARSSSKPLEQLGEALTLVGEDNLPVIKITDRHLRHISADSLQAIKREET